ncbi:MAG TPA: class I SAM-dependent methyltransferase [Actinomycetota bacterium]|jgi:SAM-dependent methyltransferase|nr:class I SAM-dependent methyltransferase [Actinomycetota bacterium]
MPQRLEPDEYATDVHRWWHLSRPPAELLDALADGWLTPRSKVIDVGCGLASELGHLATLGSFTVGVDLSLTALERARAIHPAVRLVAADALRMPFTSRTFDAALDRGCFHYLSRRDRPPYAAELARVLRPGGRLLLRACTTSEGMPNDVDEDEIEHAFAGWRSAGVERAHIDSDTRSMPALVARLERV